MRSRVRRGEPAVLDGGHLGMWSGTGSPAGIDPGVLGIQDPDIAADVVGAVDFAVVGPDADAAARSFGRQPGTMIYDIPASGAAELSELFTEHCREHGWNARLEACETREPHRERVRRCAAGGGSFSVFGVPVTALGGLPRDRALPVAASRTDRGDGLGAHWAEIRIPISGAPVAGSVEIGAVRVDWARVLFGDADALNSWRHEEPVDGRADVAFWGAAQAEAAAEFGAPGLGEPGEEGVQGWTGLGLREAVDKAQALMAWKEADPRRRMMVDFRPHSHHWQVMREVRDSALEAGTVEVGGARLLCAMTGQGDGRFPVYADFDSGGGVVAVRLVLAPSASG